MRADMSIAEHDAKRRVLDAHCEAVGREPSEVALSHNAHVFIGEDETAVERVLAEHAARHGLPVERFRASLGNAIVGTPPQCVEQLRAVCGLRNRVVLSAFSGSGECWGHGVVCGRGFARFQGVTSAHCSTPVIVNFTLTLALSLRERGTSAEGRKLGISGCRGSRGRGRLATRGLT